MTRKTSLSLTVALLALAVVCAGPLAAQQGLRIVAIGDVHGDLAQFQEVLRQSGLIDAGGNWSGGKSRLVQTGDVPDRGPDTRAILDLLMKLEKQAKKSGGAVHALIGNHEAMNVYGDLRYTTAGEFTAFQTPRSAADRNALWKQHAGERKAASPAPDEAYKAKWEAEHPLGWIEHRIAFQPGGKYHQWLAGHDSVVKVGDSLFLHAGLSPKYGGRPLSWLNDAIRAELQDLTKIDGGVAIDPEGPLWYRGLANGEEASLRAHVDALLARHGVRRIVIGHTPTAGTVLPRFGGKVVMIDAGLSQAYGARQACLLIEDGKPSVLHRGTRLEFPGESPESLLRYLRQAAALDPAPSPLTPLIESLLESPPSAPRPVQPRE